MNSERMLIARIEVRDLFGEYDYDVVPAADIDQTLPLMILYGNNGAGKTTLLHLIFHVLSPEPFGGHRTYLGSVMFSRLSVYLSGGTEITAQRSVPAIAGAYDLSVKSNGQLLKEWTWIPDRNLRDGQSPKEELQYSEFCQTLQHFAPRIHFLSDNRKILSVQREHRRRGVEIEKARMRLVMREMQITDDDEESVIQIAIRNAMQALSTIALAGTNRGYESANTIYRDIVRNLVSYEGDESQPKPDARMRLLDRLQVLCERNSTYSRYGLTSDLDVDDLEDLIKKASLQSLALVDRVLSPYLDGIQARLDALKEVQSVVTAFSTIMNEFYEGKRVSLQLADGITIMSRSSKRLRPEDLSSGEQQLMLLICNAICARGHAAVFVIDEPELSLNVKWQRKLIEALMKVLEGSQHQLILATHSLELLANYRSQVVALRNLKDAEGEND